MSPPADHLYPLFISTGVLRTHWRLKNSGVVLRNDRLAWTIDGVAHEGTFSDIREVRLQKSWAGTNPAFGLCQITFRDGYQLCIHGGSERSLRDDKQAEVYASFIRDFHRRLSAEDKQRIQFNAGLGGMRMTMFTIATAAVVLILGVLPIVLFITMRSWEVFVMMLGALPFVWPMWKTYRDNQPRSYSPDPVPEELV